MKVLCPSCLKGEIVNRRCTRCGVGLARGHDLSAKRSYLRGRSPTHDERDSPFADLIRYKEDHQEK